MNKGMVISTSKINRSMNVICYFRIQIVKHNHLIYIQTRIYTFLETI